MKFTNFEIHANPFFAKTYCKKGHTLLELQNGWFSKVWYCEECDDTYELKLIKMNKKRIDKEALKRMIAGTKKLDNDK